MTPEQFMDLMAVDKKVQDGQIRLVLMRGIGESIISDDYDRAMLQATLAQFTQA
jgi:3-dehydroquinate synthase